MRNGSLLKRNSTSGAIKTHFRQELIHRCTSNSGEMHLLGSCSQPDTDNKVGDRSVARERYLEDAAQTTKRGFQK